MTAGRSFDEGARMKLAGLLALVCALLIPAAGAGAVTTPGTGAPDIAWGAADDASKFADDGGAWFYDELQGAGLTQNRWTVAFDPSNPTAIKELPFLERAAPVAQAAGVRIILVLYSLKGSAHDPVQFCDWARNVVQAVNQWGIHDFVVGNEVNTRLYWSPQKDAAGRDVAAPAYFALLANCYDAIHGADPEANVIGMGLSPRPRLPSRASRSRSCATSAGFIARRVARSRSWISSRSIPIRIRGARPTVRRSATTIRTASASRTSTA